MASFSTAIDARPPIPRYQKASARAPFSATCHSPKRPLQNPFHLNNMPQSPQGGGGPTETLVPHNLAELRNPPFRSSTCA